MVAGVVGCASARRPANTADPLLALAPAATAQLLVVEMSRLRGFAELGRFLKGYWPGMHALAVSEIGFDPWDDVDRCVLAIRPASGGAEGGIVLIARGRFDGTRLETVARTHGGEAVAHGGRSLLRVNTSAGALVTADVFALGSVALVREVLDIASGAAAGLRADAPVLLLLTRGAGAGTAALRYGDSRSPSERGDGAWPLQALSIQVEVGDGLMLEGRADFANEEAAVKAEQELRDTLEGARRALLAAGLGGPLDQAFIAAQRSQLLAQVRLSAGDAEQALRILASQLGELDLRGLR
jgi:hypothetical protein